MARQAYLSWPNRLTMLRLVLIGPFVVTLLNMQTPSWNGWGRVASLIIFAVMAITDALDGWLARRLHAETPLGRFLDPVADKLLITCAMILLGLHDTTVVGYEIPNWVVVAAIGKDIFVVLGFLLVFIVTGQIFIEPGWSGKWCTEIQMVMVVVVLLGPDLAKVNEAAVNGALWVLWFAATAAAIVTCWLYFRKGARFVHEVGKEAE